VTDDETDPHFAVDTISCSGSIGQLSNSSDGDRKKKQKNWVSFSFWPQCLQPIVMYCPT